jgi:plasmid stabilization system protein ParE
MHRLVLRPGAVAEVQAAAEWYEAERPGLGSRFLNELKARLLALAESPEAYAPWKIDPRFRVGSLRRFPYAVFFRIEGDVVRVFAVAHTRRRPGYWSRSG